MSYFKGRNTHPFRIGDYVDGKRVCAAYYFFDPESPISEPYVLLEGQVNPMSLREIRDLKLDVRHCSTLWFT